VTPDTSLGWHRKLIAHRNDGSPNAPDETSADGQRDRSLGRSGGGVSELLKRTADSGGTAH
jgi:hypothetical protein